MEQRACSLSAGAALLRTPDRRWRQTPVGLQQDAGFVGYPRVLGGLSGVAVRRLTGPSKYPALCPLEVLAERPGIGLRTIVAA